MLTQSYAVPQIVMVRFWAFAAFALALAAYSGGLRQAFRPQRPWLQLVRSLLMVVEIGVFAIGLRYLKLAEMHALLATFPLIVIALSPAILGERVGWRRWAAVGVGFIGTLIILRPGLGMFRLSALIPLLAAFMFAIYILLTRLLSRSETFATSTLWVAIVGCVAASLVGPFTWRAPDASGWLMLAILSATSITGHLLLIKALELTPAAILQPVNYTMPAWAALIGFLVFAEIPDEATMVGALVIVASGLYALWRERDSAGAPATES